MRPAFRPADLLSLAFLTLLSTITVLSIPDLHYWGRLLVTYVLLGAATIALAAYRVRSGTGRLFFYLHTALTVFTILMIFNSLGDVIPDLWHRCTYDNVLIKIDHSLFGVHPTIFMEQLIDPMLTTVLQLAYISYYFIPISLGVVLIVKNKLNEFEEALFGIVLCFYLSYIGYLLMPAVGPRFTLNHLQTADLQAAPFIKTIQEALNGWEHNKTDAFPSGHTAVALMTIFYAWKCREKALFGILLPVVSALIFSTVYLRYHYAVDVIAGIGLMSLTVYLAPRLRSCLARASDQPGDQRHDPA